MSALRSATPSLSVCCQRADRSLRATARCWAAVRLSMSAATVSGLRCALLLGAQAAAELVGDGDDVVHRGAPGEQSCLVHHALEQVLLQRREARLLVEGGVTGDHGLPADGPGHGDERGVQARGREVGAVELGDPPPLRVQVGLGQHAQDVGAHRDGPAEELQLGRRVLLRRVGHEHHGVGRGQRGHRGRAVHRVQPAHAGGVDELEAPGEDGAGDADLGGGEPLAVAGVARLRHVLRDVVGQVLDRHVGALGPPLHRAAGSVGVGDPHERDARGLGVAHHGGHRGGDVVVHGAHRRADQRVDQQALALLELPHHQHPDVVVQQAGAGLPQPGVEIGTLVAGDRAQRQVERPDRRGVRRGHGGRFRHRSSS